MTTPLLELDGTAEEIQERLADFAGQQRPVPVFPAGCRPPLVGLWAHQNGPHGTKEVVFLSDGATWIKHLAGREFPSAVQIVDFFDACQHRARVAQARFGKDTPRDTPGKRRGKPS